MIDETPQLEEQVPTPTPRFVPTMVEIATWPIAVDPETQQPLEEICSLLCHTDKLTVTLDLTRGQITQLAGIFLKVAQGMPHRPEPKKLDVVKRKLRTIDNV